MLPHPRNRLSKIPAQEPHVRRTIHRCVAKVYGPPDETVSLGSAEAWYYFDVGIAFLFVGQEISRIFRLKPSQRTG